MSVQREIQSHLDKVQDALNDLNKTRFVDFTSDHINEMNDLGFKLMAMARSVIAERNALIRKYGSLMVAKNILDERRKEDVYPLSFDIFKFGKHLSSHSVRNTKEREEVIKNAKIGYGSIAIVSRGMQRFFAHLIKNVDAGVTLEEAWAKWIEAGADTKKWTEDENPVGTEAWLRKLIKHEGESRECRLYVAKAILSEKA